MSDGSPPPDAPQPSGDAAAGLAVAPQDPLLDPAGAQRWARRGLRRALIASGLVATVALPLGLIRWPLVISETLVVLPVEWQVVRAEVGGKIDRIHVEEGQAIGPGTPLLEIIDRKAQADLARVESEIAAATAELEREQVGARPEEIAPAVRALETKRSVLAFANRALERATRLFRTGVGSPAELEAARREHSVAVATVQEAEANLKLVRAGRTREEVAVYAAILAKHQAEKTYLERRLARGTVTSTRGGVVVAPGLRERVGRHVAAGDELLQLVELERVRLEISVDQSELDALQVGLPVAAKVAGFPQQLFRGRVDAIAPAAEQQGPRRIVRVTAVIDNPGRQLRSGLTGRAEIDAGERRLGQLALRRAVRWFRNLLLF